MSILETELEHIEPIPVLVTGLPETTREYAPELSSYSTYFLDSTVVKGNAIQILPQDTKRKHAIITCLVAADTDSCVIGAREQVQNGRGYNLTSRADIQRIDVYAQSAVWIATVNVADDTKPIQIGVIDERFIR